MVIGSKNPITQTARELGVEVSTLHTWISKHLKVTDPIIIKNNDNLHEELKRLKKEITQVTLERDILKKAAAYFAKEAL